MGVQSPAEKADNERTHTHGERCQEKICNSQSALRRGRMT